ncbi:methionine--tRNA ligase subunit beta [Candidatus Daviesbacteria bacterium]|nr:methionine--tRNA ligase subunit beta [Candidatus Daviesbacteria bacterium]
MITIEDFAKVELKVGTILEAEEIAGSLKLLRLKVDLGEETPRQILSGIKEWYKSSQLVGKQAVFITNLEPRMIMGFESQGMILATDDEKPILLKPSKKVPAGTKIR